MTFWASLLTLLSPEPKPVVTIPLNSIPVFYPKRDTVSLINIRNAGLSKLSASYLGFKGEIPVKKVIDWNANAKAMWAYKANMPHATLSAVRSAKPVVYSYTSKPAERMTLAAHITSLSGHLSRVRSSLDWQGICEHYRLSMPQCQTVMRASNLIDAKMLTAYSMTELMPYHDGVKNWHMMDTYMRNAGRNYLDIVPSLGDPLLSMGRYQFTSYAVGLDKDGQRPANQVSTFAGHYKIPQSVVSLSGLASDRAAYFFSIHNLAYLVKSMSDTQLRTYNMRCMNREETLAYLATAHHMPRVAKDNALAWINSGCSHRLIEHQGKALRIYAQKTHANYKEVIRHG